MTQSKLPAKNQIASALVHSIREGILKSGERLPTERAMIKQFKVSRSVIREALSILKAHGLIQSRFGCRPIVNPRYDFLEISQNNIGNFDLTILDFEAYEIFESRVLIETALARIAAKHATKPDILKMKNTLLKNKLAISKSQKFYETDVQFHSLLYEIPKNSIFPLIHNIYINWLFKYWELMPENIEINKKNYNDHKNIFEAIIDRDPDQAEALTEAHLKTAWQYVKLVF